MRRRSKEERRCKEGKRRSWRGAGEVEWRRGDVEERRE